MVTSSSDSNTYFAWQGTNPANPEYDHTCKRRAMEHVIVNAHNMKPHTPSATLLNLPHWQHTPYKHEKYAFSSYTHLLYSLLADRNTFLHHNRHKDILTSTPFGTKWVVDLCLLCNTPALLFLPSLDTPTAMRQTTGHIYYTSLPFPPPKCTHPTSKNNLHRAGIYHSPPATANPLTFAPTLRKHCHHQPYPCNHAPDWTTFVYVDGSKNKGSAAVGAAATYPSLHTSLATYVNSTPSTHTTNMAKLATIDLGLKVGLHALLADSSSSLRLVHKYIRSPHSIRHYFQRDVLSSIPSTLQARTMAGLTTHIVKVRFHNNFKGNNIAYHLANTTVDGQPLNALNFKGAQHTHGGHWNWPYTTKPDEPNPPKTLLYTNLKIDARNYSITSTNTPLHHTTKHGNLLATAKRQGADFAYYGRHPSLTFTHFTHKMEFLWGVHNTRLLTCNKFSNAQCVESSYKPRLHGGHLPLNDWPPTGQP
jgi:hypothetical protein